MQDTAKSANGLANSADGTIKITYLKELDADKEIKIYAYPKGSSAKTPAEQLLERKLSGKIIVLKNGASARKEEKFVLVAVWSDITKSGNIVKGSFTQQEKENFYNILHQALIVPTITEAATALDLSANADFQTEGAYIDSTNNLLLLNLTTGDTIKPMFHSMRNLFLNVPANSAYKNDNYFTIFSSLMTPNYSGAIGCVEDIGVHNAIMLLGRRDTTLPHEAVHGLGLYHTHKDSSPIKEPTRKYTFNRGSTTNIISYASVRTTTWRWQWHIINSNINEK